MKRTRHINLDRMRKKIAQPSLRPLIAAMATLSLSACSETQPVITWLDECKRALPEQARLCKVSYLTALQEARKSAPKYAAQKDCEADFGYGRCSPFQAEDGSQWSIPAMSALLMSPDGSGASAYEDDMESDSFDGDSVARSSLRSSDYRSPRWSKKPLATGDTQSASGKFSVADTTSTTDTPTTVARGGFGSTAVAKSRWSGSSSWGGGSSSWGG